MEAQVGDQQLESPYRVDRRESVDRLGPSDDAFRILDRFLKVNRSVSVSPTVSKVVVDLVGSFELSDP